MIDVIRSVTSAKAEAEETTEARGRRSPPPRWYPAVIAIVAVAVILGGVLTIVTRPGKPPASAWVTTWSARFTGPANSAVVQRVWHFDRGVGVFGTGEVERMTSSLANVHLDAVEYADQLVFMHAVKEGPANRSFGLQVAALAGLPRTVIDDARRTLHALEAGHAPARASDAPSTPQLGLFAPPLPSAAEEALRALDPDALTPREALDALYRLKSMT